MKRDEVIPLKISLSQKAKKLLSDKLRKSKALISQWYSGLTSLAVDQKPVVFCRKLLLSLKRIQKRTTDSRLLEKLTDFPFTWITELEVNPELIPCDDDHQGRGKEGLKAINPKPTYKFTKAMPRGDPYCEDVIEFKEE